MQQSSNGGIRILTSLREPVSLTLLLLLLVAIAECIYLARANSTFASQGAAAERAEMELVAGNPITRVVGLAPNGGRLVIRTDDSVPTLAFGVSVNCPGCEKSVPAFGRLARQAKASGFKVIFVSRDELADFNASPIASQFPGQVLIEPNNRTYLQMKLTLVPQAAVIANGLIAYATSGEFDGLKESKLLSAIEQFRPR